MGFKNVQYLHVASWLLNYTAIYSEKSCKQSSCHIHAGIVKGTQEIAFIYMCVGSAAVLNRNGCK